jgi:hypothetical protein
MDITRLPKVIGVTGRKYNGKDTVGNYLVEHFGYKRLAFADALKDACRCIFGFTDEQLYGSLKETPDEFWKVSPRIVLQYVGTNLLRNQLSTIMPHLGNDVWVNVIKKKILDEWSTNPDQKIVITDVRFPNEANMIEELSGIMIRVRRDSINAVSDSHSSEVGIEKLEVDYEIINNKELDDLYQEIKVILDNFK